jgi:hypothetical protein
MVLDPSADAAHRILSEEKMTKGTDSLRTAGKQLERHTRDEKFLGNAHCILKYFSPKSYAEVDDAAREARGRAQRARHREQGDGPGADGHGRERRTIRRPVKQMIHSLVEPSIGCPRTGRQRLWLGSE